MALIEQHIGTKPLDLLILRFNDKYLREKRQAENRMVGLTLAVIEKNKDSIDRELKDIQVGQEGDNNVILGLKAKVGKKGIIISARRIEWVKPDEQAGNFNVWLVTFTLGNRGTIKGLEVRTATLPQDNLHNIDTIWTVRRDVQGAERIQAINQANKILMDACRKRKMV